MVKNLLLIILINIIASSIEAQNVHIEQYTIDKGLSQNGVKCIYQDSKGYLWFGTEEGLNRYDGYTFTFYRPIPGDSTSISDNIINTIKEDHSGNLWIGTFYGGLNKYNWETGKFKRYTHNFKIKNSIPENFVAGIYEDKSNKLWCYNQFLYTYRPETDDFKKLNLNFLKTPINFLFEDKDHMYWIGTKNGLYQFNTNTGFYQQYVPRPGDKDSTSNEMLSIVEDPEGTFWLGNRIKLYEFDKKKRKFVNYWNIIPKTTNHAPSYAEMSTLINDQQFLWMAWESSNNNIGISKFDKTTKIKTDYPFNNFNLTVVHSNVPINIFKDRSDLIWVGTFLGGAIKLNNKQFISTMSGNTIGSFQETKDGSLWIGTIQNGLYKLNGSDKTTINFNANKSMPDHLEDNSITYLYEDYKGLLWVGTYYGGIYRFTLSGKNPDNPKIDLLINNGPVKAILEDLQHQIFFGTSNGFFYVNPANMNVTTFQHDPNNRFSISDNSVQIAALDSLTGEIWIGTWNGLNHMVLPKKGNITRNKVKFYSLKHDNKNNNSISNNRIISLCIAKNGILWAGTFGSGFNKISLDRQSLDTIYKIKRYSTDDGLPNNVVYGIVEDNLGNLWISTNLGLSKFNPVTERFVNYDVNDGLQSNEFFWRSYYKGRSGKIYFGGVNGYNAFDPDKIKMNNYIPPVYITGLYLFNKLQSVGAPNSPLKKQISEEKEISILYNQSVISLEYVALNFISPEKNKYAYKMVGFDKDWQYVGNQRKVTYTNLDPGTYNFKVIASNNDNLWNHKGASLIIHIIPPFWKTLWFKILLIVTIGASIISVYYRQIVQTEKANILLKRLVDERTKSLELRTLEVEEQSKELTIQRDELQQLNATKDKLFSILAHDLRNPFHIIIGFSDLLLTDLQKMSETKIRKFLNMIHSSSKRGNDLLDNILQWSRMQTGRISFYPESLQLSKIVNENYTFFAGEVQAKQINFQQFIDSDIIITADENMLNTILRNLISNAIKFTHKNGKIIIDVKFLNRFMQISISDNGVGITPENQKKLFLLNSNITTKGTNEEAGTGIGLMLCKEFVERHGGKIWFESEVSKGTTFFFTIPSSFPSSWQSELGKTDIL